MKRILIIEDEKKIAEVVQSYLVREGYEVNITHNGKKGFGFMKKSLTI
ncbi:hypothetical protein [Effusibacillus consociatus]|uniref:Response regulatory domain-containing protein n=1 Tax=Effusibacillus consociatus TaxID=1117041 RepID=A0ABV9Q0Y7_9BACL